MVRALNINTVKEIKMVDLYGQYLPIKDEIDAEIQKVVDASSFINGPAVNEFKDALKKYLNVKHVIPCGNGTDALQIALMALDIKKGSEIIVPAFSFAAPAEAVALLGCIPVFADVEEDTFNISAANIEKLITERTRAIIPVHLFGQCADMSAIMSIAKKNNLFVVEDNAQSLGARHTSTLGEVQFGGTIGNIGTTSFFPSKNLGCMGDGGALFTNDDVLAEKAYIIANHGQKIKYDHQVLGINSRLDSIQAAVLKVKIKYLDEYNSSRAIAASHFNKAFQNSEKLVLPTVASFTSHVYNQYTLKVSANARERVSGYLKSKGIPTMVYYPKPLHFQKSFDYLTYQKGDLPVAEKLCGQVLSIPMHTVLDEDQLDYISHNILMGIEQLSTKDVLS